MKPGVAQGASTATLASFVHDLSYSDLPANVVLRTEELFLGAGGQSAPAGGLSSGCFRRGDRAHHPTRLDAPTTGKLVGYA
jgi:hypothetical protein